MFVYRQGPIGSFTQVAPGLDVSWASPSGVQCNCLFGVAAGDVDGDGHQDVLVLGYTGAGAGQLHFYQGNGTGTMAAPVHKFTVSADFPVVKIPTGLGLFDLEGDGDLDVVVGGSADGTHYVYTNDGSGNFSPPAKPAFDVDNFTGIDAYDFDNDGDDDLALVDWYTRRLVYVKNLGGGTLDTPVGVGNVNGPSIGIGAPELVTTPMLALDHFKCYGTKGKPLDTPVALQDQFGAERDVMVLDPVRFCNPVAKIHDDQVTKIRNEDHHLLFYRIKSVEQSATRVVRVSNQFGKKREIAVSKATFLAVPTQKIYPGEHPPPRDLDHFKCYEAKGEPIAVTVGLKDQFNHEPQVRVHVPFALCNPVAKKHENKETKILNPDAHLMCYKIETKSFDTKVKIRNQFGEAELPIQQADVLCVPTHKDNFDMDPHITHMCGDLYPVGYFDGGVVLPGDPGTGLYKDNPDLAWPDGRPRRACGQWVAVNGYLPSGGVTHFRVAYRKASDPVPVGPGDAATKGVYSKWHLNHWSTACLPDPLHPLETQTLPGHGDGWMDYTQYMDARSGASTGCPNGGLRLGIWQTQALGDPDKDEHYVLWLEWQDGSGFHREPFEHHLQLDNSLPKINDLKVTLTDGSTPVGACGEAPKGEHIFKVYADFEDNKDLYWSYYIRVRGGKPPANIRYPKNLPAEDPDGNLWHDYYEGTIYVANTDKGGTTPDSTTVFLRDIDMQDFKTSFVDCCYLLELFVRDAALRHSFPQRNTVYESTGAYWDDVSKFFTFAAAP
jgi:hypothetical protein